MLSGREFFCTCCRRDREKAAPLRDNAADRSGCFLFSAQFEDCFIVGECIEQKLRLHHPCDADIVRIEEPVVNLHADGALLLQAPAVDLEDVVIEE